MQTPGPPGAPRRDFRLDRLAAALTVGEALLVLVAAMSLLGLVRDDDAEVRVLSTVSLGVAGVSLFAACLAAIVVATVSASTASPRTRFLTWALCGAAVFAAPALLVVLLTLLQVGIAWRGALLSIPTTCFALWMFRRMQRNRKPPWWLVLAAFAWGASVAGYVAQMVEGILHVVIAAEVLPGTASVLSHASAAAVPEELGKGAGVVVIVLLAWRRVDGMLGGIVVGACVGIGFQFAESMSYMTGTVESVLYQHWYRQVTGLLISHATYTGILGAGVGLAMQVRDWRRRAVCVGSGFAVAVAAHLVWDVFAMGHLYAESANPLLQLFVVQPVNLVVLKGPAFVVLLFLVVLALRLETRALHRHLVVEVRDPRGAVAPAEVSVLVNPPLRFRMRLQALLRGDLPAYLRVRRLHAAQLDLAFARWHRERGEPPQPGMDEALRQRIRQLKMDAAAAPNAVAGQPGGDLAGVSGTM